MYNNLSNIELDYLIIKAARNVHVEFRQEAWEKLQRKFDSDKLKLKINPMTELYIKNMTCQCCIYVLRSELEKLGWHILAVDLGLVRIKELINETEKSELCKRIEPYGMEVLSLPKEKIVEDNKKIIHQKVYHFEPTDEKVSWSKIILKELGEKYDYNYLTKLFSSMEKPTIEKYVIQEKIELVKEYLFQNKLTLVDIAKKLGYRNISHLSSQFKKVTGETPSSFKSKQPTVNKRNKIKTRSEKTGRDSR